MQPIKNLKPKIDFKKQPYAEPKFMLPPESSKLPMPFPDLIQEHESNKKVPIKKN